MNHKNRFAAWLQDCGPAALVIREYLMPVEGHDGVVFPATFAAAEDKSRFAGGYNIDHFPDNTNVCLIDSVGSQANRIEPLFAKPGYKTLVPQIVIEAGEHKVNLLEAGHRAADAIVRCSSLQKELHDAFTDVLRGNAEPLAKLAPTSLVFGVWDSRDTQAKVPRLFSSTIRAYNVKTLMRSAQFVPATDYIGQGLLDEKADKGLKDAYAERGFVHVPASGSHGGVIATGGIRRDATISLAALRLLNAEDSEKTAALQRYILALSLTAFTATPTSYLRQGCNLVPDPDKPREMRLVQSNGVREDITLTHEEAVAFAEVAAKEFGLARDQTVPFDKKLAEKDVKGDSKETGKPAKSNR